MCSKAPWYRSSMMARLKRVHASLRDQIEGCAERAAIRVLERLASVQGDESLQSQIEQPPAKKR
jgi:hypothetical protein